MRVMFICYRFPIHYGAKYPRCVTNDPISFVCIMTPLLEMVIFICRNKIGESMLIIVQEKEIRNTWLRWD